MQPGARLTDSRWVIRWVKASLWAVFAIAACALILQFFALRPRAALNAGGFIFVSFVLLAILNGHSASSSEFPAALATSPFRKSTALSLGLIGLFAILIYLPGLSDPFLSDDYGHLELAGKSWTRMLAKAAFVRPVTGDYLFRPLGYISYWLDYHWASLDAWKWHLWNVLVHAFNSILVYFLARGLRIRPVASLFAGLVFALNASHAEVTGWMAARFDLLAFLFSTLALIAMIRFIDGRRSVWLAVMVLSTFSAVTSKEAAFCLPLLALCLIPFRQPSARTIARMAALMGFVCAILLLYRTWFLRGIGGYRTATGDSTLLNFHLLGTLNALFFRLWAVLFLPLNQSNPTGAWLILSLVALLIAAPAALIFSRARRLHLLGALGLIFAAALPVQHMLLIGPDLTGSRVLYLPTLGLALFWGILLQDCDRPHWAIAFGAALLVFQGTALQHNLRLRTEVAHLSQRSCAVIGKELRQDARSIAVESLPNAWKGVQFLANGFTACVTVESGRQDAAARLNPPAGGAGARLFTWDATAQALVEQNVGVR